MNFLNVDVHFALGALLNFLLELVDFRALAADDDAGTRGVNAHDELVGSAFDVDRADAGALEFFLQLAAQLDVFVQQVGVVLVGIPARLPRLVVTEPKTVRVCLLSHSILFITAYFLILLLATLPTERLLLALFLRRVRLAGQSLAHATRGTTHALLRFGFSLVCRNAFRRSDVMLGNSDPQMRRALLIAECAAHRRRTQPLPARAFIHEALVDEQLIDIERRAGVFGLALRIGNGAAQQLFDRPGRA